MNKTLIKDVLIVFLLSIATFLQFQAKAEDTDLTYSISFTDSELDNLLAPIALYPDPLLAQMLPASTYPAEIADAAAWSSSGGNVSEIEDQNWDESVKALARYPDVLKMMSDNMDWTANLGDAFLNQPEDVAKSVQRLRQQARDMGNLASDDKQIVNIVDGNIEILPARPQIIYIPIYDPAVIYFRRPVLNTPPFILFGPPLVLGGWLAMDFDWGHHQIIYHGWNRRGWVNNARPYVHVTNVYINNSRPAMSQTWRHDASHGDPARYLATRPNGPNVNRYAHAGEVRGQTAIQPSSAGRMFGPRGDAGSYSTRGRESRGIVNQQTTPLTPSIGQHMTMPNPSTNNGRASAVSTVGQKPSISPSQGSEGLIRPHPARESMQPVERPSAAFGGYRGADEARALSLRGQSSRQSSVGAGTSPRR